MASIIAEPHVALHFGAMAPSISEQLEGQGLTAEPADLLHWQKDADAITRLTVRQMLPESQAHAARKRLMKKIAKAVKAADDNLEDPSIVGYRP